MCLNAKKIYRNGIYKEDNYRGKKGEFYDIEAFTKCGTCSECMNEKANAWVVRNEYEAKRYKNISFITLTYSKSPMFLVKKDLQDFIKRFRSALNYKERKQGIKKRDRTKIRYFACGEYGTLKGRPHFHIIMYNWIDKDMKFINLNKKGNAIFESELINKCWNKGITTIQEFNPKEIPYISLYCSSNNTLARAYKMSKNKAKKLLEYLKAKKGLLEEKTRRNMVILLQGKIKEIEHNKSEYVQVKEFNTFSKSIGWEEFAKDYYKNERKEIFKEYIAEMELNTPTSWVKKLANKYEDKEAIKELYRRENEMKEATKNKTTEQLNNESLIKEIKKKKERILNVDKKAIEL